MSRALNRFELFIEKKKAKEKEGKVNLTRRGLPIPTKVLSEKGCECGAVWAYAGGGKPGRGVGGEGRGGGIEGGGKEEEGRGRRRDRSLKLAGRAGAVVTQVAKVGDSNSWRTGFLLGTIHTSFGERRHN